MTTRSTRSQRRRTVVALAVVLAIVVTFVVRLVDIQIVNASEHLDNAQAQLGAGYTVYGTRGSIVDTNGEVLAGSVLQYDCQLSPSLIVQTDEAIENGTSTLPSWSEASQSIATIIGSTPEDVQKIASDALAANPDSQFAYLVKGASTETYRALADLGLPYIACPSHSARTYPDGAVAGNLVGFVDSDGEALEGLELSQDACLAGTDGQVTYERGTDGVVIPGTEEEVTAAEEGGTLQLTIDRDLQYYLQQLIAEQTQDMSAISGQIMVVEVGTGKIRAAAEYPTVDPNDPGATDAEYRSSTIFRDTFEPGSTFKALTASALIDSGAATPTTVVQASGREELSGGARVTDAVSHGTIDYTLTGVLIDSSNVGISKLAELIPAATRADYLSAFGIGQGTDSGYPAEANGLIHPVEDWDSQTFYNTSFGQGVTTTLPELVGAYQAIANDGVKLPLSLVESCTTADGTVETTDVGEGTRVVSEQTATEVQQMLENVFLQGGLSDSLAISGYRVAGKTGTGEIAQDGTYLSGVYFTTLIGFAPADDPQYVVAVTLNQPTAVRSSAANAEAFQKAMTQVLKTYRVEPSTTEATLLPRTG